MMSFEREARESNRLNILSAQKPCFYGNQPVASRKEVTGMKEAWQTEAVTAVFSLVFLGNV